MEVIRVLNLKKMQDNKEIKTLAGVSIRLGKDGKSVVMVHNNTESVIPCSHDRALLCLDCKDEPFVFTGYFVNIFCRAYRGGEMTELGYTSPSNSYEIDGRSADESAVNMAVSVLACVHSEMSGDATYIDTNSFYA